jgi:hypothetical protein
MRHYVSTPPSQRIAKQNPPDERVRNSSSLSAYSEESDDGDEGREGSESGETDEEDLMNGPLDNFVPSKRKHHTRPSANLRKRAIGGASSDADDGWGNRSEEEFDYSFSRLSQPLSQHQLSNLRDEANEDSSESDDAIRGKSRKKVNDIVTKYGTLHSNGAFVGMKLSKLKNNSQSQSQSDAETNSQTTKRKALNELESPTTKLPKLKEPRPK